MGTPPDREALLDEAGRQASRVFRPADPGRLAHALRVNLQHLEVPLVFETEPARLREHVDLLLDLVFHGLVSASRRRLDGQRRRAGRAVLPA